MKDWTLAALEAALAAGRTSSRALTEQALAAIADPAGEGARAFTRVYRERALAEADASDARRAAGAAPRPLEGIPISIKDLFDVAGEPTLAGSVVLRDAPPAREDAAIVARLRAAGAVIVGKTNMTEFAFSGIGINPHYGTPRNPWDRGGFGGTGRIPGGSSSGAAVSVTDGMAAAAIGTDTGGSVRIPSALCGLVGLKPTAARVPKEGCLPLSGTLDSIGPLARSVDCCARVDAVLAGRAHRPMRPPPLRGLRIGFVTDYVGEGMDAMVAAALDRARQRLSAAGAAVIDAPFPELLELPAINAAGGFPAWEAWHWHRELITAHGDRYDPRVAVRILKGRDQTAAEYEQVRIDRERFIAAARARFAGFDALAWAVTPVVAPSIAALEADERVFARANALILRNPATVNFLDGCAMSLPCHEAGGAPVGLMLARQRGEDLALLEVAAAVEPVVAPGPAS